MNLPSIEQVPQLWDQYHTPEHIRRHMVQVSRVATTIAQALITAGESVILPLVDRAAALHDTVRVTDWDTLSYELFPDAPQEEDIAVWKAQRNQFASHIPHSEVNYQIFRAQFPEMAQIIRVHSIGAVHELRTIEERIVHYADRRVAHDQIVTMKERLEESYQRYAPTAQSPLEHQPAIRSALEQLEQQLFASLPFLPAELPLNTAPRTDISAAQWYDSEQRHQHQSTGSTTRP